jgi:diguanylate cyclase (GGDEF)-like protein
VMGADEAPAAAPAPAAKNTAGATAELQANLSRLSNELVTLSSFSKVTASADPLPKVTQSALRVISRDLALTKVAVFTKDELTDEIRLLEEFGHTGDEAALLRSAVAGSYVEWVIQKKQVYPDPTVAKTPELEAVAESNQLATMLALPLVAGEDVVGALLVTQADPARFDLIEVTRFLAVLSSLLALRIQSGALMERVRALAVKDEATGLFLRAHGDEVLEGELARAKRYEQKLGFLLLEVLDWPKFERQHGTAAAQRTLLLLGETLGITRKGIDCGLRFGPAQLALILPSTDDDGVLKLAQRLLAALRTKKFTDGAGRPLELAFAIGLATYPDQGTTPDGLASAAIDGVAAAREHGGRCAALVPNMGATPVFVEMP